MDTLKDITGELENSNPTRQCFNTYQGHKGQRCNRHERKYKHNN